jgi:iron-sulfur cluster insertion protein
MSLAITEADLTLTEPAQSKMSDLFQQVDDSVQACASSHRRRLQRR